MSLKTPSRVISMQSQRVGTSHCEPKDFRHLCRFPSNQNGLAVKEVDWMTSHHKSVYKLFGSEDMKYKEKL